MRPSRLLSSLPTVALFTLYIGISHAAFCSPPAPGFPPPDLAHQRHLELLSLASHEITDAINELVSDPGYDRSSFSIEVTSQTQTLLSIHHTAHERSTIRHGADMVTNSTCYRIASMTKPFTVLALFQLYEAGKLALDDSVLKYLPSLEGSLPWKDITLRSLASQIAGIPRDFAQGDRINYSELAAKLGLPHLDLDSPEELDLPKCDEMVNYTSTCNGADLLDWVAQIKPMFAPNQKSSYSNINYNLLGLVIANVSGLSYEEYIAKYIVQPLKMTNLTGFDTPPNKYAAIPKGEEFYWPYAMGVQNPTGGLYANSADMSVWLRYVLSTFNAHANGALNWFNPTSYSGNLNTFYGMPWEIFRTSTADVLSESTDTSIKEGATGATQPTTDNDDGHVSTRPLTFVTKGGGLPGYTSNVIMLPEYSLGITILVAGRGDLVSLTRDIAVRALVKAAEQAAIHDLRHRYVGTFTSPSSSSATTSGSHNNKKDSNSISLAVSPSNGLFITAWSMNNTDVKRALTGLFNPEQAEVILHVVPTLLFADEAKQRGERWRIVPAKRRRRNSLQNSTKKSVWDDFCIEDVDWALYAGKPLAEVVFWGGEDGEGNGDGQVEVVELTGWRAKLTPSDSGGENIKAAALGHGKGEEQQHMVLGRADLKR